MRRPATTWPVTRMKRSYLLIFLIAAIAAAAALGLFLSTYYGSSATGIANTAPQATQTSAEPESTTTFWEVVGVRNGGPAARTGSPLETIVRIILHLLLAVILATVLAFRPRKNFPLFQRNLYVAQTQILLAAVAAALMMVVGDNAARAFAIFAAASIVRFRTNIRDPKEVTVLLISLTFGLASGVGRWDLGVALCAFSLPLLFILEYNEQEQAFRSMELSVKTRNTDLTQEILKKIFKRNGLDAEVRQLDPPDAEEPIGHIQYYLNLRLNLSTDVLSDRILAADRNIEGIQWSKTKSATDVYQ